LLLINITASYPKGKNVNSAFTVKVGNTILNLPCPILFRAILAGVLEISRYDSPSNPNGDANAGPLQENIPGLGIEHLAIALDSLEQLNKFHEHFTGIGHNFEEQPTKGKPLYITEIRDPDG
jgi:hypothetical protein